MYDFVEVFALVKEGEVMGYRFFTYKDDKKEVFDVQTESTKLTSWCSGRLQLIRNGNLLMTEDEITGTCKPLQLRDKMLYKKLVTYAQYYKQLQMESSAIC